MSGGDHEETIVYIVFLSVILFFIIVGSIMEAKKLKFGHETTAVILVGMAISWGIYRFYLNEEGDRLAF